MYYFHIGARLWRDPDGRGDTYVHLPMNKLRLERPPSPKLLSDITKISSGISGRKQKS